MNPYEAPREKPSAAPTMAACTEVLVELGATPKEAKPWLYRMLWRLGLEVRPPLYAGLLQRLLIAVGSAAVCWGGWMYLSNWRDPYWNLLIAFSPFLALVPFESRKARTTRRTKKLPEWEVLCTYAADQFTDGRYRR